MDPRRGTEGRMEQVGSGGDRACFEAVGTGNANDTSPG